MSTGPKLSVQDLIRDAGLDGGKEFIHCYIAEAPKAYTFPTQMHPIGYSICFFSYSTWEGKSYFMEDVYVKPAFRCAGVGSMLFKEVAKNAQAFGCKRLDFHVLSWNPARRFYERLGANDLTESEEWHYYRLQGEALKKVADQ